MMLASAAVGASAAIHGMRVMRLRETLMSPANPDWMHDLRGLRVVGLASIYAAQGFTLFEWPLAALLLFCAIVYVHVELDEVYASFRFTGAAQTIIRLSFCLIMALLGVEANAYAPVTALSQAMFNAFYVPPCKAVTTIDDEAQMVYLDAMNLVILVSGVLVRI